MLAELLGGTIRREQICQNCNQRKSRENVEADYRAPVLLKIMPEFCKSSRPRGGTRSVAPDDGSDISSSEFWD